MYGQSWPYKNGGRPFVNTLAITKHGVLTSTMLDRKRHSDHVMSSFTFMIHTRTFQNIQPRPAHTLMWTRAARMQGFTLLQSCCTEMARQRSICRITPLGTLRCMKWVTCWGLGTCNHQRTT